MASRSDDGEGEDAALVLQTLFSREGSLPFLRKKLQDLAKQAGQNRKIRASAHFNELKTYKSAKKISLFLVRLLSGLRLLYGRNLLL